MKRIMSMNIMNMNIMSMNIMNTGMSITTSMRRGSISIITRGRSSAH